MQAEIIALGTELTNGSKLDTNSQWLSTELAALGIEVVRHTTIGDCMDDMIEAIQSAARRSQLAVITGGLGPTLDDLTRQAMAEATEVQLELHQRSLEYIENLFQSRGREMPDRNRIQAMFPAGSIPIENPRGTAPGIDMTIRSKDNACRFVALPRRAKRNETHVPRNDRAITVRHRTRHPQGSHQLFWRRGIVDRRNAR